MMQQLPGFTAYQPSPSAFYVDTTDNKFTWEIPVLKSPRREEIGSYIENINLECINLPEFPKVHTNTGFEFNYIPYTRFDVTKLYTQTELRANDFLSKLDSVKPYMIDAKSNCTIQINI